MSELDEAIEKIQKLEASMANLLRLNIQVLETFVESGRASNRPSPEVSPGLLGAVLAFGARVRNSQDGASEMFNSVIMYGRDALKVAMLINGGAAIALLAFVGNIWPEANGPKLVPPFGAALSLFCYGVLSAAIGCAFAYLTQLCYNEAKKWPNRLGIGFHILGVAVVFVSFGLFACGIDASDQAITVGAR